MAVLPKVWAPNREGQQVSIQPTTVHRTLNEITVRVYDKSAGTRFIFFRAAMLLLPGEGMKLTKKRYPLYVYEVTEETESE